VTSPLWAAITGQERAVTLLARTATAPGHAYLLVGPPGTGTLDAARRLAAALVCPSDPPGCSECSACRRALSGAHPDVIEVEPEGTFIVVGQIGDLIKEAFRSPFEAERKVIIVSEADRMNETAANKLLKTLEEPAERTHFVLLTDAPDELLPTVRSRCQRIDFTTLTHDEVFRALTGDGVDPAEAQRVARLAAGQIDRARGLTGRLGDLHRGVGAVVRLLDGRGGTVAAAVETLTEAIAAANAALEATQKAEAKALETEVKDSGYPDRLAKRLRTQLEQRQQREARRAKTDALLEVVTALECTYRDALIGVASAAISVPPERALRALDACRDARAVIVNRTAVNETLLLEHLLLQLPPSR
jgi:DNA polymerase-3 subunit delta'